MTSEISSFLYLYYTCNTILVCIVITGYNDNIHKKNYKEYRILIFCYMINSKVIQEYDYCMPYRLLLFVK